MAGSGRISVLVSKELLTLMQAIQGAEPEMRSQIRKHTKAVVGPVWQESVRGNVSDRLETRVLSDSARVAVSDSNVILKSGGVGSLSSGTPRSVLARAVEFGANRETFRTVAKSRGLGLHKRRTMRQFKLPRSRGYVVYPAAREVIPRIASLWIQTAIRTLHESFEKGGAGRG